MKQETALILCIFIFNNTTKRAHGYNILCLAIFIYDINFQGMIIMIFIPRENRWYATVYEYILSV